MDICLFLIFTLAVLEQGWSQNSTTVSSITLHAATPMNTAPNTTTLIHTTLHAETPISTATNVITPIGTTLNSTTSLVCQNGVPMHGFCLCLENWSGATCNIQNFCPEQESREKYTFPKTFLGQFASSSQLCPVGTPNAGIPQASALCNITTGMFDSPNILKCDLTLNKVFLTISGASFTDKKNLASNTQTLTSIPENLTPENITNAVKIANILLSSDESMDIAVPAVAVVSQLLNASHGQFSDINHDVISELTKTLQKVSLREKLKQGLVQPNLAVQTFKGTTSIRQVQIYLFKGQSNGFLPDKIKLNSSQNVNYEPDQLPIPKDQADLRMNITFNKNFDKVVGFVLYDGDQFFQSQRFKSSLNTNKKVLSAALSEYYDMELQFAVMPLNDSTLSLHQFACVFWSYSEKDWSTEGCIKTKSFSGHVECICKPVKNEKNDQIQNNLNFAILMTFNINYQYSLSLHWISIIGCSLSIVGLAVTVVYQIATRKSRGCSPTLLLVNICLSMIVFYLLFIFGINNTVHHGKDARLFEENTVPESDYKRYSDEGPCTIFTALIHYFLLATFTWNFLYGIHVFFLFKASISGTPPWFLKVSVAFGWGFPAILVGISLGSLYRVEDPLGYRQEEFCWLASLNQEHQFDMRKPIFWAFLLPLVIMLISNTAMLLHFSHNICKTNPNLNSSRQTPLKKKILSSFSLGVMLGLTWVTGYILLITHQQTLHLIMSIVFCICNTTQGIQIFVLFTLKSFLNSNPAFLNTITAPDIGLHRKHFFPWKVKLPESRETYTPTNPESASPPQVINESGVHH